MDGEIEIGYCERAPRGGAGIVIEVGDWGGGGAGGKPHDDRGAHHDGGTQGWHGGWLVLGWLLVSERVVGDRWWSVGGGWEV